MAACARKRGLSVATVAKAKADTRFSVRVRVVYNLLKRVSYVINVSFPVP